MIHEADDLPGGISKKVSSERVTPYFAFGRMTISEGSVWSIETG